MESPLALYRRYRPETFAEVIGQDHVTEPLRAALASNRVNHAYLFSGPRGCGKTTSARILARALNCEQAPIADPCGECRSCRDLARGGPGSIDVIEIDAASHGGVDDARDLREKAFFAPVQSRYKVYVIDEAHMVTTQGFNALLKLVEEPPPHLRFIFATTEPEKVIPTIRSRTHHYPFRLIPPRLLSSYLSELCQREGVPLEPAAVPLVVRAGGGSARDTLSVLDQLIGGSGSDGVTHALATGLLGYTPDSLLDEIVDAFAAADGGGVFRVVDKVIETGQDPRRFTEDLLRRLRDLVIVAAVPDAPTTGLLDVSDDAGERLTSQAARFGGAELSRAADLVATGLTEMRGATSPRLLLELICARVLLPGADSTTDGVMARLDRLERRLSVPGGSLPGPAAPAPAPASAPAPSPAPAPAPERPAAPRVDERPQPSTEAAPEPAPEPTPEPQRPPEPTPEPTPEPVQQAEDDGWPVVEVAGGGAARRDAPQPEPSHEPSPAPQHAAAEPAAAPAAPATTGGMSLAEVRRLWPDVVDATKSIRRVTWIHLSQHAQVVAFDGNVLTLGFANAGARQSFESGGSIDIVRQAAARTFGFDWRIEAIVDPGAAGGAGRAPERRPEPPAPQGQEWGRSSDQPGSQQGGQQGGQGGQGGQQAGQDRGRDTGAGEDRRPEPSGRAAEQTERPSQGGDRGPETRGGRGADGPWTATAPPDRDGPPPAYDGRDEPPSWADEDPDAAASPDDPDDNTPELAGTELLERELGARVIEQIRHD
ncbi:DNA polymerase III subunit gamma and tau [Nocardioides zeae]|uniref:DNA polymerase III subunit gamma/tau n=1 Tax=Nocardioides imazamoxiresistens TaxID=3231893 RepID=A0ABU3PW34_9ACTN|nr:DNA polymerase III subunit gamma and tau [Nocardioides zeae]MDT9593452.1 DNA polymerase III subunit gamma and tau [Nocardioides zeae]